MTVLHLICSLGGGGAERQLVLLARSQQEAGLDVQVAYVRDGVHSDELAATGCACHRIDCGTPYRPVFQYRLRRALGASVPDLIHSWMMPMDLHAWWLGRRRGVPWILAERNLGPGHAGVYPAGRLGDLLFGYLRRTAARRAALVVANSSSGARAWGACVPRARVRVVPNAVPEPRVGRSPRSESRSKQPCIVAAGRMVPDKNWEAVLAAVACLRERGIAVRAECCGDGPQRNALQARAAAAGLGGCVSFPGYVDDLSERLAAADLLLHLGLSEGMPNVVLEAVAAGVPLVLSDRPFHRELATETMAAFVPAGDAAACADGVAMVLRTPEPYRQACAAAARERWEQWSPKRIADLYGTVYREAIATGREGSP